MLLNGVSGDGPLPVIIVSAVLLAAGTAACLVPVRRVFAIEPALAMPSEERPGLLARSLNGSGKVTRVGLEPTTY